jgi:DNA-binding response OmpR family regulator
LEPEIIMAGSAMSLSLEAKRPNSVRRVLLLDADQAAGQVNFEALIKAGYEVELARDGVEGWETLLAGDFDLVITENAVPRMSGLELIEKLRAAHRTIPVIMAAAVLPKLELQRMPWLIPDAMLERPFTERDLLKTVKRVLRREEKYNARMQMLLPLHL